jgi:hypothetical protein
MAIYQMTIFKNKNLIEHYLQRTLHFVMLRMKVYIDFTLQFLLYKIYVHGMIFILFSFSEERQIFIAFEFWILLLWVKKSHFAE